MLKIIKGKASKGYEKRNITQNNKKQWIYMY